METAIQTLINIVSDGVKKYEIPAIIILVIMIYMLSSRSDKSR